MAKTSSQGSMIASRALERTPNIEDIIVAGNAGEAVAKDMPSATPASEPIRPATALSPRKRCGSGRG